MKLEAKVLRQTFTQCEEYITLLLPFKMGRGYAEDPFNICLFYNLRYISKLVHF